MSGPHAADSTVHGTSASGVRFTVHLRQADNGEWEWEHETDACPCGAPPGAVCKKPECLMLEPNGEGDGCTVVSREKELRFQDRATCLHDALRDVEQFTAKRGTRT